MLAMKDTEERPCLEQDVLGHRFDHILGGISGISGIYGINGTHSFFIINIFP